MATAVMASPALAAVYNGQDATAPLADISQMTFTCVIPTSWESNSSDSGKTNEPLANSHFLDGNKNHLNNNDQALSLKAPLGASSHWNNSTVDNPLLSAVWTLDLGSVYAVHDVIMYASMGNRYWGMLSTVIQVSTDGENWTQVGSTPGVRNSSGTFTVGTEPWVQDANITDGTVARYVRITASDIRGSGNLKLDELDLFITPVPEPASLSMIGILGGLAAWAGKRK